MYYIWLPALPFGTPESDLPTHSYELPCFIIFLSSPSCFDVRLGFHMLVGDWDSNAPVVFWIDVLQWVNYYVVCKKHAFYMCSAFDTDDITLYRKYIHLLWNIRWLGQPAHPGDPGRWHGLQYGQRSPVRRASLARFPGAARTRCPPDGRAGLRLSAWACGLCWVRKLERLVKLAEFWGWTLVVLLSSFNSIWSNYRNDCHYFSPWRLTRRSAQRLILLFDMLQLQDWKNETGHWAVPNEGPQQVTLNIRGGAPVKASVINQSVVDMGLTIQQPHVGK